MRINKKKHFIEVLTIRFNFILNFERIRFKSTLFYLFLYQLRLSKKLYFLTSKIDRCTFKDEGP